MLKYYNLNHQPALIDIHPAMKILLIFNRENR